MGPVSSELHLCHCRRPVMLYDADGRAGAIKCTRCRGWVRRPPAAFPKPLRLFDLAALGPIPTLPGARWRRNLSGD
jgi:hypothetical protein